MRLYTPTTNVVVPASAAFTVSTYSDQYVNILFGSVTRKALTKSPFTNPPNENLNDTEVRYLWEHHHLVI